MRRSPEASILPSPFVLVDEIQAGVAGAANERPLITIAHPIGSDMDVEASPSRGGGPRSTGMRGSVDRSVLRGGAGSRWDSG